MKPKIKDISVLLLVILALTIIAVLFGRSRSVTAFDSESSQRVVESVPTLSVDAVDQKELYSEEIQALFLNMEKRLLTPGWLHIVYKTTLSTDTSQGSLPNGVPFPSEYLMEDWYLLDNENYAIKAATFMRDIEGNILQRSILVDGIMINTTFNDQSPAEKLKPAIDLGYMYMAKAPNTVLKKIEAQVENRNMDIYEIRSASPDKNIQQIIVKVYFDENGNLVKSETILINADGSESIENITEVLLMENVQAPSKDVTESYDEVQK